MAVYLTPSPSSAERVDADAMDDVASHEFEFMYRRTLVRHERGTILVMIMMLSLLIAALVGVLIWTMGLSRRFSTPSIYRGQEVEIQWGKHGQ